MNSENNTHDEGFTLRKMMDLLIKIGLLIGLLIWCFLILRPFFMIALWGLIIAIALFPLYNWLKKKFGGRRKLTSVVITLGLILILLIPMYMLGGTLFRGIVYLRDMANNEQLTVPAPPETVQSWPVIGQRVFKVWKSASENLAKVIEQYTPQIKNYMLTFVSVIAGISASVIKFLISIVIAGVFLVFSESGSHLARDLFVKLIGDKGADFVTSAGKTIRSVAVGILGVAVIQSLLAGIGFLVAGVPAAGLWALVCLFLGIIQIGISPVLIIVIIYMFIKASTLQAVGILIWSIIIGPLDNILKPVLLGRGSQSPMLVIFLGAIGGFILSGFIGLFVGAVILSLGYNFFILWLRGENRENKPVNTE
jgi:predicted PurR-regulated permease PerM